MSLLRKVFLTRIPRHTHEALHRWANGAIIPLAILVGGTLRVLATATTPFEEYLGIAVTLGVALGWAAVFVNALPGRRRPEDD